MYCPKCGVSNSEDVLFCRSCGLDLGTVARAMEKLLPLKILTKIDVQLLNPKKIKFYDGIVGAVLSAILIIVAFYYLSWGYKSDAFLFFIVGGSTTVSSIWHLLIYVRSRSKTQMIETYAEQYQSGDVSIFDDSNKNAGKLPAADTSELSAAPRSVTEQTTQFFTKAERQ